MSTFSPFSSSRAFQVWEYQVGHGHLLIRSPRSPATRNEPEQTTNLDLHFWGVDYLEIPRLLRGVEIAKPTSEEVDRIEAILKGKVPPEKVVVFFSENQRFVVVADSFKITENQWDIFESPIEFRSRFRAN